eukprot:14539914-Alexandrium_andersonii.AAC.1
MPASGPFPRNREWLTTWGPRLLAARRPGGRRSVFLWRGRQTRLCDGLQNGEDRAGGRRGGTATSAFSAEGGGVA